MAAAFCRRREMQIASLRFHALLDGDEQREAQQRPVTDPTDQRGRAKSFWGWTDRSDAARSCRLAIERDWSGHEAFFINDTETVLAIPTAQAIDRAYPGVPLRKPLEGFASAIDASKAADVLGWVQETRWVR